ncbi:MAG: hypothetical protein FJY86_02020 [Candidatus Diapherotrites archaeon]|uniref:Lon proteolytic domain-containing protein n=1 Tax=Candidatus Iainarchaeum sp. TaxID=3101447 RepID=A0A8T4C6E8_9ARCH|nr:hypothetical protein [Candidatus Diapherotrites archaeon]
MKRIPIILVFLTLLLVSTTVWGALPTSSLKVFAVAPDGTVLEATLGLKTTPGNGTVWSSVSGPLVGTATQSTEKIAVKVAKNYSPDVENFDYFFSIDSEASVVDGPSAGSAMALLVVSSLRDQKIPTNVGLTGTITNTGEVGPVGGVFEKAKEASKNGIKLFLIPQGESKQVVKLPDGVKNINLPEYALKEWGMKVVETRTLDDVLTYAFTNIDTIDINQTTPAETPAYIPPKISTNPVVSPMHELNTKFIEQTREIMKQAQAALNQTLLDDDGLIEVLSRTLDESEKTVNEAELLTQNGYEYSAGNYTFLSKVNAYFVHDVAEDPELIDLESDALLEKVTELETVVEKQQKILDKTVPIEGVEWYIAAQQRLTWAQLEIAKLKDTPTIIVVTEDAIHAQAVERVQNYEFAKSWHESSQEFYDIALRMSTKGLKTQSPFVDYYADFVKNAQNGLEIISTAEGEDAQRRLDAAVLDQAGLRHLSAAMNSASALALINATLVQNDSNADIRQKLEETIESLDEKMNAQLTRYAWARLYLDHAKYYLNSANYYANNNQGAAAASNLSSGLSLALLAENTYEVIKDVDDYYASLPASRFTILENGGTGLPVSTTSGSSNGVGNGGVIPLSIGENGEGSIVVQAGQNEIPVTGILLAVALFLGVVLIAASLTRRGKNVLETPLESVSLSPAPTRESNGFTLYRVDQLEAQLMAARQGLRHAEHQYTQGGVSQTAYGEMTKHYQNQIRTITKDLRAANSELRKERAKKHATPTPEKSTLLDNPLSPRETKSKKITKKWPPKKKASATKKTKK